MLTEILTALSARELALNFKAGMREALTPEQIAIVNLVNTATRNNTCATHDFCDANQVMLDAFEQTFERELDFDSEDDTDLVNLAWSAIKLLGF